MQIEPVAESMNLLLTKEAEDLLGMSSGYMSAMRSHGYSVPYVLYGKTKLYEKDVILEFKKDKARFRDVHKKIARERRSSNATTTNPFLLFLKDAKISKEDFIEYSGKPRAFLSAESGYSVNLENVRKEIESLGANFEKLEADYVEWRKTHAPPRSYVFDRTSPLGQALFEKWGKHGAFRLSALTGLSIKCIKRMCMKKHVPNWESRFVVKSALEGAGLDANKIMSTCAKVRRQKIRKKSGLYSSAHVSKLFAVSTTTLCRWREKGYGPACQKIGRLYFYKKDDVKAFIHDPLCQRKGGYGVPEDSQTRT